MILLLLRILLFPVALSSVVSLNTGIPWHMILLLTTAANAVFTLKKEHVYEMFESFFEYLSHASSVYTLFEFYKSCFDTRSHEQCKLFPF